MFLEYLNIYLFVVWFCFFVHKTSKIIKIANRGIKGCLRRCEYEFLDIFGLLLVLP